MRSCLELVADSNHVHVELGRELGEEGAAAALIWCVLVEDLKTSQ
jgi:hypothetical protein